MDQSIFHTERREPWNKGKLVGQKAPLKLKEIWAIRVRLQLGERLRELVMFNLAIDSKLRSCDLVKLRVRDVCNGDRHSHDAAYQSIVDLQTYEEPPGCAAASWAYQAGKHGSIPRHRDQPAGKGK